MQQVDINNDMIIKKIENSNDYDWLVSLLKTYPILQQRTILIIKKINSFEVQEILKKNYKLG